MVGVSSRVVSGISDDPLSLQNDLCHTLCDLDSTSFVTSPSLGYSGRVCTSSTASCIERSAKSPTMPMYPWRLYTEIITATFFKKKGHYLHMTHTLSDVCMSYTTNARQLSKVNVLCGQHTSTCETMDQPTCTCICIMI